MKETYLKLKQDIETAQRILLVSHRKPDADTLGAAIAMAFYVESLGKSYTLACFDKPAKSLGFLPRFEEFVDEFYIGDYDLVVVLDAGAHYMTNFHLKYGNFLNSGVKMVNIDHHASNDNFGDLNIVEDDKSSVTIILYNIFEAWGFNIDADVATCLLAGIYNDTGSFMHSNTDCEVYRIAAVLLAAGADYQLIVKRLFKNSSLSKLRLWGRVFEKAFVNENEVLMSLIDEEDYITASSSPDELTGAIDYLNMVPGSKLSVLVNEDRRGNLKGSMRTRRDDVDLAKLASDYGGGGHPKASGFTFPGKLEDAKTSLNF